MSSRSGGGGGGSSDGKSRDNRSISSMDSQGGGGGGIRSKRLEKQKQMCEKAMSLVNAGVTMQNNGDQEGAEKNLAQAVGIMEEALRIEYTSSEEVESSQRLNKKMNRYVKMIKSQRAKNGGGGGGNRSQLNNIVEFETPLPLFQPVLHLLANSSVGDLFTHHKNVFGFQEGNVSNQKEHLLLLLTNYKKQLEKKPDAATEDPYQQLDHQQELDLANQAVTKLHTKLFVNYKKWAKHVSQSPHFSKDQLSDIVLFFLIWGESSNFRQMPELLCFLFHKMAPISQQGGGQHLESGDFLNRVIRPMYDELQRESSKKTAKGARAAHTQIRNYDDFNEFFWKKKCLKFDIYTIGPDGFAATDKKGNAKVIKKSFKEKRSWFRAIRSFYRIFFFNCALFMAVFGFAVNMSLLCPDSPIMYGQDMRNVEAFGKLYYNKGDAEENSDDLNDDNGCLLPKLATCLGIETYIAGKTFKDLPKDFQSLYRIVPFTDCVQKTVGRCSCYLDYIERCFLDSGEAQFYDSETKTFSKKSFNQARCLSFWKDAALKVIKNNKVGNLNCDTCQLGMKSLIKNPGGIAKLIQGLIDFGRTDSGVFGLLGGAAFMGIFLVFELQNRFFSPFGNGMLGRSLHVPCGVYCRYTCFWLFLLLVKLMFDYQFMIKSLVETTIFIWVQDKKNYLQYSNFMIQQSYHNILFILFLWIPSFIVFMYDLQIFYAIFSVIFGSIRGFNLRIGELRSFRILRLTFKKIPSVFNKKIVPNISDLSLKKKKKKKKKKNEKTEEEMPVRRFERISYSQGSKPLTVKTQKYSHLLENQDDAYNEMKTPSGGDDDVSSSYSRNSNLGSITGVSGADFERTIPFAMAWNRCLSSLREADVLSDRELNVLSYLIDSKEAEERRLYTPAFLTAGKLDESIDIVMECSALYEKLKTDKKKKEKALQKIETAMRERLLKDDLRVEAILGCYKFSSMVIKLLLGEEHREIEECFNFMEEAALQQNVLKAHNLNNLYQLRAACSELMKSILQVPRPVNEAKKEYQRSLYHVIDNVESVMAAMSVLLSKQEHLVKIIQETPIKPNSFFYPGDAQNYSSQQLQKIVNDQTAMDIVSRAYQLLTVDNFDAEPRSEEGRRRLRFFANSLFMDMPDAQSVKLMRSISISTPYYNEIVMYSIKDLTSQNDDCVKLLYYLQTVYPFEWENLLERLCVKDISVALEKYPEEVRLWASYRGQTLARTVRGMMYNEEAIRFLHWLEIGENEPMHLAGCNCNRCNKLDEMVSLKFNYVCTCQIFGRQKDEQRQQAHDIEYLLGKHPNLRVAYVDGPKKVKDGPPKFFSVLVRSIQSKVVEIYRVELPGNPIVGEGKPENQNHSIIFSRGEMLQCIDMNQDGYFEECLKLPNLLATADRHSVKRPLTIIGFREHVFTGGVSSLASFMSIQELSFVSLGQRMLALFHVRQHYGHPDIFDKLFAMTTGGTAKASKGINLSEDIFAGFNTTLRGGLVSHEEFMQVGKGRDVGMQQLALFEAKISSGGGECVISRDCQRMATRLDFFRLHSWFYGNLGWYFTQTMTVMGIYFFIYGKIYMALSGLDSYFLERGGLGIGGVLNTSWALQFGFLLVVPVIAVVGVEKGFRHGFTYLLWNCLTLGPLFFTFQMGTRMHYFDRTLIHGGAKYRATGRGFTIKHEKFAELFRFYAFSHFYRGVEIVFLLLLFLAYGTFNWCNCSWRIDQDFYNDVEPSALEWKTRCYANHFQICVLPTNQNYGIVSFSLWLIAATWLWAPFFFNPSGLDWDKLIEDYNDWQNWLRTMNDSSESWFGWWNTELDYLEHSSFGGRFSVLLRKSRFMLVAVGIYLQMAYKVYYKQQNKKVENNLTPYILASVIVVMLLLMICCGYTASRVTKKMSMKQRKLRKMKFYISMVFLVIVLLSLTFISLTNIMEIMIVMGLMVFWFMQMTIVRLKHQHIAVRALARAYDRFVGWVVFGPILFVGMFLPFISAFQQRVMFNNAFTSGLEVSKLFSHDIAPTQVVKVKKVKKKKNRDD